MASTLYPVLGTVLNDSEFTSMSSGPISPTAKTSPTKPFQFPLRQLLILTTICAAVLAAVVQFGFVAFPVAFCLGSAAALLLGAYYRSSWIFLGLAGAGIIAGILLLPTCCIPRSVARRSQCSGHFKQIVVALHNYHDEYGSFPPAYIADAKGQPLHSWRVLLLPYIERADLYARYNFSEPWNGPNNRKLMAEMPHEFGCPSEPGPMNGRTETSYVAVVGPGTVWPGEKAVGLSQILDGTTNTLLVVEIHDSGICWLEPRDLHTSQMPLAINPPRGQGINSRHGSQDDQGPGKGVNAVFCDGHTQFLPNTLSSKSLRAMLTIGGGETVTWDE